MAQYRKKILTNLSQEYPQLGYNQMIDYELGRYNEAEPYQIYSNYEIPVRQEIANESYEYTYSQEPSKRIIFRSYFRPISNNDAISEYNRNKYGHKIFPKEQYYISICPHCGSQNAILKQNQKKTSSYKSRTYQKNEYINQNQRLCENCQRKMMMTQNYNLNTVSIFNQTLSPNNNQSIYLMPYGQKSLGIKKCTCKIRTTDSSEKNKIILTEDKDLVNQKSKNLKTETVTESVKSNKIENILPKGKGEIINNKLNNNADEKMQNNQ